MHSLATECGAILREALATPRLDMAIEHGVPFQQIIDLTSAKQVDLIVMGTHGRTGLQHFLLGSVAERVLRLARARCW